MNTFCQSKGCTKMATVELEFQGKSVAFCDPCWKKKTTSLLKMTDGDWQRLLDKKEAK